MNSPLFPDVTVNGERITTAAIAAEAQNHDAPRDKPGWAWRKAARALVIRALLLQEAARRGLTADPRTLGPGRRETEEEALIRSLLESELSPEPPAEDAIRAAYDSDPGRFRSPALYQPAHILFAAPVDDHAARVEARRRAEAALSVLRGDPTAFERLAQAESACPSRDAGGRLGQIAGGDTVPEFEAALDTLEPGTIAPEPVETRYGLHVLRLDARAEGAVLPYAAVRPQIAEALEKLAWTRAARDLVGRLAARAELTGLDRAAIA